MPGNVLKQKLRACALKLITMFQGYGDLDNPLHGDPIDPDDAAERLFKDPAEFCRKLNPHTRESKVIHWDWERDQKRCVMVPPSYALMVTAPKIFRADIRCDNTMTDQGIHWGNHFEIRGKKAGQQSCSGELSPGYESVNVSKEYASGRLNAGYLSEMVTSGYPSEPITVGYEEGLPMGNGHFFAIFPPLKANIKGKASPDIQHRRLTLGVHLYTHSDTLKSKECLEPDSTLKARAPLLYLASHENLAMPTYWNRHDILPDSSLKLLGTNQKGAMLRASAWWGHLESRYDALLAANLNPDYPENRWIMLSRYRIWVVYRGYSRELSLDCLDRFSLSENGGAVWLFSIPTCEGEHLCIEVNLQMKEKKNQTLMQIHHCDKVKTLMQIHHFDKVNCEKPSLSNPTPTQDHSYDQKVKIIIRPDIENRSFHDTVKAWMGPETQWKKAIQGTENSFTFSPDPENGAYLHICTSQGSFTTEPEWHYMVHHPMEALRGLDPDSDLFSPGFFTVFLKKAEQVTLMALCSRKPHDDSQINFHDCEEVTTTHESPYISKCYGDPLTKPSCLNQMITTDHENNDRHFQGKDFATQPDQQCLSSGTYQNLSLPFAKALLNSMDAFLVERGKDKSVIAGYPWFLDWGRDSLIFSRALIEVGRMDDAKAILRLFGQFEQNGTLPNMICGRDAGNRETSDAPLWFFAACREITEKEGDNFLHEDLGQRSIRDILISMGHSFIKGTSTGVIMDQKTSMIYSPSHFTWMDTNHPAGSPRQGYPVEIQALWHYALTFLARIDHAENRDIWQKTSDNLAHNLINLFYRPSDGYFSDCLHLDKMESALNAKADDALRPNQLLLITLGVIKDEDMCIKTLESCMELLIPGAIRSLSSRKLKYPLEIHHNGKLLKDPYYPYSGQYKGDEDTQRKPAYHNGTAWTWPFPLFCEAWAKTFGDKSHGTALSWLGSALDLLKTGAAGYLPEILDGDFPHKPGGCDAQAWGSSEFARVWSKLFEKSL
ncbi:Amylo-alpha-16-glucosidase (fragment) [Desulfamplus magnetovallimortis]|uniref:Amylo-alpha-16-glucosidase n=2 Tax=Desulfamplus magnetovallimortis TaxID=1246637 RepID=A0A1W1H4N0_9BACT